MQELLSQNENIAKITEYINNPTVNVCLLEGRAGSFKTHCVDEAVKHIISDESSTELVFNIKCFESTTLDDIFLLFLDRIKNYAKKRKLSFSKLETNDISLRINHYLTHIKSKSIVIIDSLQNVFNNKNEKDKEEIIRFIDHLASLNNYKLLLVSNFFPNDYAKTFKKKFIPVEEIKMQMLSKQEIREYFSQENHTCSDSDIDEFYELSKGSPAALLVTSNILSVLNTNLTLLIEEYTTKQITFGNYLIQKIFTFVPEPVREPIECLAVFNGGLPESFLIQEELFNKEQIDYLVDKGLLVEEYGLIYVKSYIRKYLQKSLSNLEKNKFHQYWKLFYSEQLPLKPVQRVVLMSRNTMRAQIEYHTANIIQQKKNSPSSPNLSLVSYLNSDMTAWNYQKTNINSDFSKKNSDTKNELKNRPEPPESIKNKQQSSTGLEKYELTEKELGLLGVPIDMSTRSVKPETALTRTSEQRDDLNNDSLENNELDTESEKQEDIESTINLAVSMEDVYNFETAATFYLQALDMKDSPDYERYQTQILSHLAVCCEKMNRTSDAIDFYNKLVDIYTLKNDIENVNKTKLSIAEVYKNTYKLSHAKVIYENFIKNIGNDISNDVLMYSYIGLADIESLSTNSDRAMQYYEYAFDLDYAISEPSEIIAQACFRYATLLDENHDIDKAVEYYKKCIEFSQNNSGAVSNSYTNLAEIAKDYGDIQKSIEYFKKAVDSDTELSNDEGIYYIALQLGILYEKIDKNQSLHWLLKSLNSAKKTTDMVYIVNAYIETGDFYARNKDIQKALKAYLNAQKTIESDSKNSYSDDMAETVRTKLSKIKNNIEKDVYERIVRETSENE